MCSVFDLDNLNGTDFSREKIMSRQENLSGSVYNERKLSEQYELCRMREIT